MRSLKPLFRSLGVIEHLITGSAIALYVAVRQIFGLRTNWVPEVVRWWYARLCRVLGVRIEVAGELSPNALLVANHISWLDIPVLGSRSQMDFLSKSEIRDWPLIGWMAGIIGTLFITRGANQTCVLIPRIGERVRAGRHVTIFPEGTTSDGSRLRHFHPRLFGAGQLGGVSVQPVALRYGTDASPDAVVPFVGDDSLLPHLARLVRHPDLRVQIRFLVPLDGSALTRRQISEHCHSAIAKALGCETSSPRPPIPQRAAAELHVSPPTPFVEAA